MWRIAFTLVFLTAIVATTPASACGECEYEDGFLKICLPKASCIIPNPVKTIPTVIEAIASGDPKKIAEAVGATYLQSTGCIGCNYAAQKVFPQLSESQINLIAGEGLLTFLVTGEPVLVIVDMAQNTARQISLAAPPANGGPIPPPPPARGVKQYTAGAECIIIRGKEIYAGWKTPPVMIDTATGAQLTFPDVDLRKGDIVNVTSRLCSEWDNPETGQTSVSQISFIYDRNQVITEPNANLIKYFLFGNERPVGS